MRLFRQESCSGLPFPSPGDLPDPGIKPESPTLQGDSLLSESLGRVLVEFVTALLLFSVWVFLLWDMWDLSSLIRYKTHSPCIGRRSFNDWTAREVTSKVYFSLLQCERWRAVSSQYPIPYLFPPLPWTPHAGSSPGASRVAGRIFSLGSTRSCPVLV